MHEELKAKKEKSESTKEFHREINVFKKNEQRDLKEREEKQEILMEKRTIYGALRKS